MEDIPALLEVDKEGNISRIKVFSDKDASEYGSVFKSASSKDELDFAVSATPVVTQKLLDTREGNKVREKFAENIEEVDDIKYILRAIIDRFEDGV